MWSAHRFSDQSESSQNSWTLGSTEKAPRIFINTIPYLLPFFSSTPSQETQRLLAEPVQGIEAAPDQDNARYFHVAVHGPQDVSCNVIFVACLCMLTLANAHTHTHLHRTSPFVVSHTKGESLRIKYQHSWILCTI